jgi:RHS repeat-associated protein
MFSDKEKDEETGYHYFGARYYDSDLSIWLSVDPLAGKHPNMSPYAYCANNPIRYIDPDGREYGDFFDRQGTFLGTDGIDDGKVYILNEGKRARTENTNVNWGGTLAEKHVGNLKSNSSEVSMDSELGNMIRAVYAEMRGGDDNAKAIVAESIYNRSQMKSGYEKADGTYSGIISKFYDVSKSGNVSNDVFSNPIDYIYKNDKETGAWRSSVGASIKADSGNSNVGQGVIFYNSASSTFYDKNPKMQKITLDVNHRGIKGLWKLK